jgi:hypothetical protein
MNFHFKLKATASEAHKVHKRPFGENAVAGNRHLSGFLNSNDVIL